MQPSRDNKCQIDYGYMCIGAVSVCLSDEICISYANVDLIYNYLQNLA